MTMMVVLGYSPPVFSLPLHRSGCPVQKQLQITATDQRGYVLERGFSKISEKNAMQWPLRRSRSFKVTDFGTNRKLV